MIEYIRTENAVLKEQLGKKRILLSDDQRRRLAVKGKMLGRKQLEQFGTLFTPDTILRWHRQLVAKKWDYSDRKENKPGRPRVRQEIVDLILQFAKENPTWGYDRVQGELAKVGYHISDTTVGNVLKAHGNVCVIGTSDGVGDEAHITFGERLAGSERSVWKEVLAILGENTITNSPQILGYPGQASYRTGRIEESRFKFERVLTLLQERSPTIKDGPRWWYMTMILAKMGETEKATTYFGSLEAQLRNSPDHSQSSLMEEARELLGPALADERGSP